MWGFFVVVPLIGHYIQPGLIATLGQIPIIGALFSGAPLGLGVLTAGLILAIMILPFISALFVDIIESAPQMLKESAYGVGSTTYEVFRHVSVPYGRAAIVGSIMLGLGRALGETMAVTFVIGNATRISASLFDPGRYDRLDHRQPVQRGARWARCSRARCSSSASSSSSSRSSSWRSRARLPAARLE